LENSSLREKIAAAENHRKYALKLCMAGVQIRLKTPASLQPSFLQQVTVTE
jgi:hypothetical protein